MSKAHASPPLDACEKDPLRNIRRADPDAGTLKANSG